MLGRDPNEEWFVSPWRSNQICGTALRLVRLWSWDAHDSLNMNHFSMRSGVREWANERTIERSGARERREQCEASERVCGACEWAEWPSPLRIDFIVILPNMRSTVGWNSTKSMRSFDRPKPFSYEFGGDCMLRASERASELTREWPIVLRVSKSFYPSCAQARLFVRARAWYELELEGRIITSFTIMRKKSREKTEKKNSKKRIPSFFLVFSGWRKMVWWN